MNLTAFSFFIQGVLDPVMAKLWKESGEVWKPVSSHVGMQGWSSQQASSGKPINKCS